MAAGRPTFDTRPVSMCVYVHIPRPPSHYTSKGEIRTRHQHAIPPGDTDNYAKAIADALNQLAYRDDTQITCWAAIVKQWANTPGDAHTDIRIWTNTPNTENDAQATNTPLNPPDLAARSARALSEARSPE